MFCENCREAIIGQIIFLCFITVNNFEIQWFEQGHMTKFEEYFFKDSILEDDDFREIIKTASLVCNIPLPIARLLLM